MSLSRFSWRRRTSLMFSEMRGLAREITVGRRLNSVNVSRGMKRIDGWPMGIGRVSCREREERLAQWEREERESLRS